MGFDYTEADVTVGRLVPVIMDMLPLGPTDEFPVAYVEFLGADNKTLIAAQIAAAGTSSSPKPPPEKKVGKKEKLRPPTVELILEQTAEERTKRRAEILHAVRKLKAWHTDGAVATDADIPAWIDTLPQRAVDRIWFIARNDENFVNGRFADPKDLAEK